LPDDEETREQMAEVALPLLRKVFGLLATMSGLGLGQLVDEKAVLSSTSNLEELQALQSQLIVEVKEPTELATITDDYVRTVA
jgi:hypothetical protein